MPNPTQPSIQLTNTPDYRESYANSVQVRVNVWDFFLVFGTLQQQDETQVEVRNFQGIYLSPQQAKALYTILQQNLVNYENTFGEIKLDPRMRPGQRPDPLSHGRRACGQRRAPGRVLPGLSAARIPLRLLAHLYLPVRHSCALAAPAVLLG